MFNSVVHKPCLITYFFKGRFMATKGVRFNKSDEEAINDFLEKNPYFDFSTLARMAIIKFIQNPTIELQATDKFEDNKNETNRIQ